MTGLVCHAFKELSSPFLITRVVFAHQTRTIEKLYDVMEHPYFRKYVTELILDESRYHGFGDMEEYKAAVLGSDRPSLTLRADDVHFTRLCNRIGKQIVRPTWSPLSAESPPGLEKSWVIYARRFLDEHRLRKEKILQHVTPQVLAVFPRLQHITLGDFCTLARHGESYEQCCDRQFGHVLEPEPLGIHDFAAWVNCFSVLQSSDESKRRWHTLDLGANPFATLTGDMWDQDLPRPAMPLLWPIPDDELPVSRFRRALQHTRQLTLPLWTDIGDMPDDDDEDKEDLGDDVALLNKVVVNSFAQTILLSAATSLTYLKLGGIDLMSEMTSHPEVGLVASTRNGRACLQVLLFSVKFPSLEHLDLRGWVIECKAMLKFLEGMSSTLQELRLIRNIVLHHQNYELARAGGLQMSLHGVEVNNYEEDFLASGIYDCGRDIPVEKLWLNHREFNSL